MDMEFRRKTVENVWKFTDKYDLDRNGETTVMFAPRTGDLVITLCLPQIVRFEVIIPLDEIKKVSTVDDLNNLIMEQLKVKLTNWDINKEFAKIYDAKNYEATWLLGWLEQDEEHLRKIVGC